MQLEPNPADDPERHVELGWQEHEHDDIVVVPLIGKCGPMRQLALGRLMPLMLHRASECEDRVRFGEWQDRIRQTMDACKADNLEQLARCDVDKFAQVVWLLARCAMQKTTYQDQGQAD